MHFLAAGPVQQGGKGSLITFKPRAGNGEGTGCMSPTIPAYAWPAPSNAYSRAERLLVSHLPQLDDYRSIEENENVLLTFPTFCASFLARWATIGPGNDRLTAVNLAT